MNNFQNCVAVGDDVDAACGQGDFCRFFDGNALINKHSEHIIHVPRFARREAAYMQDAVPDVCL